MHAVTHTAAPNGIEPRCVAVEADVAWGMSAFSIVGLPDSAVQEARERVRAAIAASDAQFPSGRVTVNLAPADLRKGGGAYDLPIALAVLAAAGHLPAVPPMLAAGELGLDGSLRPIPGTLLLGILAARSRVPVVVPRENAAEVAAVADVTVFAASSLREVTAHLLGTRVLEPFRSSVPSATEPQPFVDLAQIAGQQQAKRAVEIAAAGGHNLLLIGPPGSGKTLLANALAGILPPLGNNEMLETTAIWSVAGRLPPEQGLLRTPPFRGPHHTASAPSIIGGGTHAKPGEVSLAHNGVLFLDEFPEFRRDVLEALREPLEEGTVTVARAAASLRYPARFQLVAAMNPCPCGFAGSAQPCRCSPAERERYNRKLSGPLLDRLDLTARVDRVPYETLATQLAEGSAPVAARVLRARAQQRSRGCTNAAIPARKLRSLVPLEPAADTLLREAGERLALSARAYHRALRVARTVADLGGLDRIGTETIAEVLQYRAAVLP